MMVGSSREWCWRQDVKIMVVDTMISEAERKDWISSKLILMYRWTRSGICLLNSNVENQITKDRDRGERE